MAKDPAFLFYSQDFFVGTSTMSFEDKGKYVHIMCLMHQQGRLDEETIRFSVGSISVKLKSKFLIDINGFWYNKRLEAEIEKRKKFTKSRVDNGLKGGRPKKGKTDRLYVAKPTDNHMGIENDNINNTVSLNNNTVTINTKGQNEIFNTRPNASDFNGLPNEYFGKAIQLVKFTKAVDITEEIVNSMWEIFKVQKLTGEDYHANKGKVYSYFIDWIKFQNFNNGQQSNNSSDKSIGAASRRKTEALRNY